MRQCNHLVMCLLLIGAQEFRKPNNMQNFEVVCLLLTVPICLILFSYLWAHNVEKLLNNGPVQLFQLLVVDKAALISQFLYHTLFIVTVPVPQMFDKIVSRHFRTLNDIINYGGPSMVFVACRTQKRNLPAVHGINPWLSQCKNVVRHQNVHNSKQVPVKILFITSESPMLPG